MISIYIMPYTDVIMHSRYFIEHPTLKWVLAEYLWMKTSPDICPTSYSLWPCVMAVTKFYGIPGRVLTCPYIAYFSVVSWPYTDEANDLTQSYRAHYQIFPQSTFIDEDLLCCSFQVSLSEVRLRESTKMASALLYFVLCGIFIILPSNIALIKFYRA